MSLCRNRFISVFVFLIPTFVLKYNVVAEKEIIQDLPIKSDFVHYLNAVEKVVDFYTRQEDYDLMMHFGVFIIDVNLRKLSRQKQKSIPSSIQSRLEKLFEKNDILFDYCRSIIKENEFNSMGEIEKKYKVGKLFYNATSWRRPPDTFNLDLLNQTELYNETQLENIYGNWEQYIDRLKRVNTRAKETVDCMITLAQTEHLYLNDESQLDCMATPHCKHLIQEGEAFGHYLIHRFTYMMIARFHRRCNVFSEKEDKNIIDQLCLEGFYEAEYIALNEFKAAVFMYGIIMSCSVFGHAQFLRYDWIKRVLVFQTREGCFSHVQIGFVPLKREDESEEWKIERQTILHRECVTPFTAMAAGALSSALRYIIESYF